MKKSTNISNAIDATNGYKIRYDTNVKFLLADKQILSRILKYTMKEFADMELEEIEKCICDDVKIGQIPIDRGLSNVETVKCEINKLKTMSKELGSHGRISGTSLEDNVPNEGVIYYDVRFSVIKDMEYKFLINIEAQKTSKPSELKYHIESRMIFYLSRMISAQKEIEFTGQDYDSIKKVISIWICMDKDNNEDSIEKIHYIRTPVYGNAFAEKGNIDLMEGIIIRIRKEEKHADSKNKLICMLEDLFSNVGAEEKKQKMTEKHGLTVSTELEGRFNFMCNLSDVIEERALEKGQEIGKEIGQLKTYVRMYEKGLINDVQIKEETGYTIETARKFLEKYEN